MPDNCFLEAYADDTAAVIVAQNQGMAKILAEQSNENRDSMDAGPWTTVDRKEDSNYHYHKKKNS